MAYEPLGDEFLVNSSTAGDQFLPEIAALAGGGYIICWSDPSGLGGDSSGYSIKAQLIGADGLPIGAEFLVNSTTSGDQKIASVDALSNGGFAITWSDYSNASGDSSGSGIIVRAFAADGTPVTGEISVNTTTTSNQVEPYVAGLANGGFVVTWIDYSGSADDPSAAAVRAQVFAADGTAVGDEVLVNTQTNNYQIQPQISGLENGNFIITWASNDGQSGDASGVGVKAQLFAPDGTKIGGEFLVNTELPNDQSDPTVTGLVGGGFVITWNDHSGIGPDSSGWGIRAQMYDASGDPVGGEFLVNTVTYDEQQGPSIAALPDGGFVITWMDYAGTFGGAGGGIKAQIFHADGSPSGGEFLVNTIDDFRQLYPDVAAQADGSFLITWISNGTGGDGSGYGVKAQLFAPEPAGPMALGNLVWNDADGDGARDAGEAGIAGVSVSLFKDDGDGVLDADDTLIGSDITDGSGAYQFTGLAEGDYIVRVDEGNFQSGGALSGMVSSPGSGGDPDNDVDHDDNGIASPSYVASGAITLNEGTETSYDGSGDPDNNINNTVDFGFYAPPAANAQDDAFDTDELTAVTGNLFADNGSGADEGALAVTSVNGQAVNVGVAITLASGALLTVNADGSFSYDPNGAFEDLAAPYSGASNLTGTDSFTYTVNGGDTATATITLSGVDNDDVLIGIAGNQYLYGGQGDDRLIPSTGQGWVDGAAGVDTLVLDGERADYSIESLYGRIHVTNLVDGSILSLLGVEIFEFSDQTVPLADLEPFTFTGTAGSDYFVGGYPADHLIGGDADDYLYGRGGDDLLDGDAGNDRLFADIGSDTLNGGDGDDLLAPDAYGDFSYGETLSDFGDDGAADQLDGGAGFDRAVLRFDGTSADIVADFSDPAVQQLLSDGTSVVNVERFEIQLGSGNDQVTLGAADDVMFGGAGNDVLSGGGGRDNLYGEDGDDTLDGGAGDDSLGGGAGNDQLLGGDGNDFLSDDYGNNNIDGGDGDDTLFVSFGGMAGVTFSVATDTSVTTAGGTATLANIEGGFIYGSESADHFTGGAIHDYIYGAQGNDVINGGGGGDALYGADGDDELHGDDGDDYLDGGSGTDLIDGGDGLDTTTLNFFGAAAAVNFSLASNPTLVTNNGTKTLVSIEGASVTGTNYDDTITGGAASDYFQGGNGNDTLNGAGGNDTLIGGNGTDSLNGGDGIDRTILNFYTSASGINFALSDNMTVTDYSGAKTLISIEAVTLYGTQYGDTVTGGIGDDELRGGEGDDTLSGGDGDDFLEGAWGNDTLDGGAGDDRLYGGDGTTVMTGGAGDDTLQGNYNSASTTAVFTGPRSNYSFDIGQWGGIIVTDTTGADGVDTLYEVDFLQFSDGTIAAGDLFTDDTIYGTEDGEFLVGTLGDDTISALGGNDTIAATGGTDFNDGGDGFDQLRFLLANANRFASAEGGRTFSITDAWVVASDGSVNTNHSNMESLYLSTVGTGDYGDTIDASAVTGAGLILRLGAGNDTVTGGGGDDDIITGLGINSVDAAGGIDNVIAYFDNSAGATAYVTSSGGTVLTTVDGTIVNSVVNAEYAQVGGFYASGVTTVIDASGYTPVDGVTLVLRDSNGSDVITGSSGADFLANVGLFSLGSDTFTGNGGADVFDWTYASDNIHGDVITDLDSDDTLDFRFNNGDTPGASPLLCNQFIGSAAFSNVAGQYRFAIVGNQTQIQVDSDGNGIADQVMTIANGTFNLAETFAGSNILHVVGQVVNGDNNGNLNLRGTLGDDIVNGFDQPDRIYASQGNDFLDGGGFNDRLQINLWDTTLFAAPTGARTYTITSTSFTDDSGLINTTMTSIERLTFSTQGLNFDDTIDVSGFVSGAPSGIVTLVLGNGNNTVIGSQYDDFISVGTGENVIDGGAGSDTVQFQYDNNLGATAYITGSGGSIAINGIGIAAQSLTNVENVTLGGVNANVGTTIDASGLSDFAGVLGFGDTNGSNISIGHSGADFFSNGHSFTAGNDVYTGNGGADIYDYTWAVNAMDGDTITDLDADDIIDLQFNTATQNTGGMRADQFIGSAAFSGSAGEYRYYTSNGQTFVEVDTNGDGAADETLTIGNGQFALGETTWGSNQLHIIGTSGTEDDDFLEGTQGDDQIYAQGGNDIIAATGGMDHNYGGEGYDELRFITGNAGRFVQPWDSRTITVTNEWVGASDGTINSYHYDVEQITIRTTGTGDYGDTIDASALTNAALVLRLGAGNDTVTGGSGDDSISVGLGINTVDAGGGIDTVFTNFDIASGATAYVTNDGSTVFATVNGTAVATVTNAEFIHIEGVNPTGATTIIDASGFAPMAGVALVLRDSNGSDVIIGSAGGDYLSNVNTHTAGADTFTGNGGADVFDWTYASDNINGDVITDLDADDTLDFRFNNGDVAGASPLLCNQFIGMAAFSNVAGQYRFAIVGNQTQIQVDTDGDGAADQVMTIANGAFNLAETAPGSNILQIVGLVITGTGGNDTLSGTLGDDVISGLGGGDTINASQGDDNVDGGSAGSNGDRLVISLGNTALFDAAGGARSYTIDAASFTDDGGSIHTNFTSIERFTFNDTGTGDHDDTLDASGLVTTYAGTGFVLNATLGNGNNSVTGSDYSDLLTTGSGNDVIDGGGGNDFILAGLGNNIVDGGAGQDNVSITWANGSDTVYVTGTAALVTMTVNGVVINTIANAEAVEMRASDYGAPGTHVDASGLTTTGGFQLGFSDTFGSDVLIGSHGNDFFSNGTLNTGGGDTYTGNGGADIYDYTFAVNGMNGDTITDFDADDTIDLQFNTVSQNGGGILANHFIGAAAFSGTAGEYRFQISGNQTLVQVDTNGDGLADETLTISNGAFALVETAPGSNILKLGAVFTGTSGDDAPVATGDNDTIIGLAGNDLLRGGLGDDVLIGGDGVDRAGFYTANPAIGGVTVSLLLQGSAQNTGQGWDTLIGIENVSGTAFADVLTGDGNDNWLWGSTAQISAGVTTGSNNDILDGGGGHDLLTVGIGDHTLIGGSGNDTVRFTENGLPEANLTLSLATAGAQATGNGSWTLTGIENLVGGTGADQLTGNNDANILAGYAGDDLLFGGLGNDTLLGDGNIAVSSPSTGPITIYESGFGSGNDTLDGGAGADRMVGGQGNDLYYVDNAGDVVVEVAGEGNDTVQTGLASYTLADNVETLVALAGITISGNAIANSITTGTGNSTINAGDGDDVIDAGTGIDTVNGGTGSDRLVVNYAALTASVKVVFSGTVDGSISATNKSNSVTFTSIEHFTITTGSANDTIITAGGNDIVNAGAGTDSLNTGAGEDFLSGGAGADSMNGGQGNDTYEVDNVGDAVVEGAGASGGIDTVRILTAMTYTLAANVENATLFAAGTITDNALDNVITGSATAATTFNSVGGTDQFTGGSAGDTFNMNASLSAGDQINGGAGNDTVTLRGVYDLTLGANTLVGIETLQLQSFAAAGHHYTLTMNDANVAAGQLLTVNGSALANDEALRFNGSAETDGRFEITGGAAGDTLTGGAGSDTIRGGAGIDTITGGLGNDFLSGGNGNDIFIFGPGSGQDHITDFTVKKDVIAINGVAGVDDFSDLNIVVDGPNAVISWGTGDSIILDGVKASTLTAADFSFGATAPASLAFGPDLFAMDYGHHGTMDVSMMPAI